MNRIENEVRIAYTSNGILLGTFTDEGDFFTVTNPVVVNLTPQGASLVPFLMVTTSNEVQLLRSECRFNGGTFEPEEALRNHYNSQFGSGIQIATNASKLLTP